MSIEKKLENASNALVELYESLKNASIAQIDNCVKEVQQKGYYSALKNLLIEAKNLKLLQEIEELKLKNRELEQRREASTVNPGTDEPL